MDATFDVNDPTPDLIFAAASERYLARIVTRVTMEARVQRAHRLVRELLAVGGDVDRARDAATFCEENLRAARLDECAAQEAYEAALLNLSLPRKAITL
jgi:hypothetical protein